MIDPWATITSGMQPGQCGDSLSLSFLCKGRAQAGSCPWWGGRIRHTTWSRKELRGGFLHSFSFSSPLIKILVKAKQVANLFPANWREQGTCQKWVFPLVIHFISAARIPSRSPCLPKHGHCCLRLVRKGACNTVAATQMHSSDSSSSAQCYIINRVILWN